MDRSQLSVVAVDQAAYSDSPTAGIQESVDSLPQSGGVVFLPRGTYEVRRSIWLRSGVTLCGEGPATILTRPAPVMFDLTAPTPTDRIEAGLSTVEGLKTGDELWICEPTQGGWNSRHIAIKTLRGHKVEGTLVAGDAASSYGPEGGAWGANYFPMIMIPKSDGAVVEDLTVDGGSYAYDAGRVADFTCAAIAGFSAVNLSVRNVIVRRWYADGICMSGDRTTVTGCLVEECLTNGYHPGSNIRESKWTNNVGRRNGWNGFYFCLGVRNAVVANNVFTDNKHNGIGGLSDPDANNIITNNVIARNGRRGIDAFRSLGNVITGNLFQDNSQSSPGTFSALWMEYHSGNLVTNNSFIDTQKKPTQITGIETFDPLGDNLVTGNFTPGYTAAPTAAFPKGELRATSSAPKLDGRLDTPAWKGADQLTISRLCEDNSPVTATTQAAFLYDKQYLYVGVRCSEPLMDRLRDKVTERGGLAWAENDVELFLIPDPPNSRAYQFVVNSLGTICELKDTKTACTVWDSKAQAAVHRGSDFWSVEIAIPLEALGIVKELKPGQEWKINVCRARRTAYPEELTAWSPTLTIFCLPRRFGTLTVK